MDNLQAQQHLGELVRFPNSRGKGYAIGRLLRVRKNKARVQIVANGRAGSQVTLRVSALHPWTSALPEHAVDTRAPMSRYERAADIVSDGGVAVERVAEDILRGAGIPLDTPRLAGAYRAASGLAERVSANFEAEDSAAAEAEAAAPAIPDTVDAPEAQEPEPESPEVQEPEPEPAAAPVPAKPAAPRPLPREEWVLAAEDEGSPVVWCGSNARWQPACEENIGRWTTYADNSRARRARTKIRRHAGSPVAIGVRTVDEMLALLVEGAPMPPAEAPTDSIVAAAAHVQSAALARRKAAEETRDARAAHAAALRAAEEAEAAAEAAAARLREAQSREAAAVAEAEDAMAALTRLAE